MKLALAGAGHGRASYLLRSRGYLLPLVLLAMVVGFGAATQKRPAAPDAASGRSESASRVRCSLGGRLVVRMAMTALIVATPPASGTDATKQRPDAHCAVSVGGTAESP